MLPPRCCVINDPKTDTISESLQRIRDLSVSGRCVTLRWRRRRFVCGGCGERHLETHREFDGKLTRRLARRLVVDAQQMSLRAVARTHGVGWGLIMGHVGVWATLIGDHRRSQRCGVLLVDETSMRRRHRYVTVIVNGETGQILDMLPGRSEASGSRFFAAQRRPRGRLGVGGIGLAPAPARLAVRADHLHHRHAPSGEMSRHARPVAAGAFDADTLQVAPTAQPVQELAVAGAGRRERRHTQQPPRAVDGRRHMVVPVGVDPTDHCHLMFCHNDSALLRAQPTGRGTTGRDDGQCTHGACHKASELL